MKRVRPFNLSVFIVTLLIIGALIEDSYIYKQQAYSAALPPPPKPIQTLFTDLSDDEIQSDNFPRYSPDARPGEHPRVARLDWKIVSDALKDFTRVCLPLASTTDCREFFPFNPPSPVQKFSGPEGTIPRLSWVGHVNGDASSEAIFIIREQDQAISGTIRYQGHIYDIRPVGRATISIVEVNPQLYVPDKSGNRGRQDKPPHMRDTLPHMPDKSHQKYQSPPPVKVIPQTDRLTLPRSSAIQVQTGHKAQIDVMVVYTKQAKATVEASCDLCLITDKILEAIKQANNSLGTNSQLEFRLAYVNEVDYAQTSVNTALSELRAKDDGVLDEIYQWRCDSKADVVSLWVESNSEGCGEADSPMEWVSPGIWNHRDPDHPENWGFSVVRRNCATNFLTFHHELGHNMGADHDRVYLESQRNGGPPLSGYGYGYVSLGSQEATIMGIPPHAEWFVNMWSSPANSFPKGSSAGTPDDNNLQVLNETATKVSGFGDQLCPDNSPPPRPSGLQVN